MVKTDSVYEVLSPWTEAVPIAFHAISPRVESLDALCLLPTKHE